MESLLRKGGRAFYRYLYTCRKQAEKDLIIFISDNGIKMANRMRELFADSLPKIIDIRVILSIC